MKTQKMGVGILALALLGCGSDNPGTAGFSGAATPGLGSLSVQMVSPRSLQGVTLRYFVNALDGDGVPLVEEVSTDSSASSVEAFLAQLPATTVRVLVRVETTDGEVLATYEQEVAVAPGQAARLDVGSYFLPGQTREIGLVSLGANGIRPDGASVSPVISSTGRLVAFASRSNLVAGGPADAQQILLRDRVLGTLSRVSINANGNPVSSDCFEPDIDASGDHVVFRAGNVNQQGSIFVRLRERGRSVFLQPGRKPRIAPTGDFVVLEFIDINQNRQSIVLRSVGASPFDTPVNEIISRNSSNGVANGDSSKPCVSSNGRFVVFATQATDIIPGGTPGIYLLDRTTSSFQRLPLPANLDDTSITPDGKFVLASAPGQIPQLFDRELGTATPVPEITGLVGRPSMSRDAKKICFFSSSSNLIDNDLNNQTDCFVFNRELNTMDRVNISNDGTAVSGGVDNLTPLTGPAISGDGRRIAFSSRDSRLVPNNSNPLFDIYSSSVPTPGLIYAANDSTIFRFQGLSTASGPIQPAFRGFAGATNSISKIFLDVANDRLYVAADGQNQRAPEGVFVFNQASRLTGNNISADRLIESPDLRNITGMVLDPARDILYAANGRDVVAVRNASTVNGTVPASGQRVFKFAASGHRDLMMDVRQDELYVTSDDSNAFGGRFVGVVRASTASGTPNVLRALFGPNPQLNTLFLGGLALDTSAPAFSNSNFNDARLVVGLADSPVFQLSTFNSNGNFSGFLGNVPPSSVTPIEAFPFEIHFDQYTNLRYVGGNDGNFRAYRSSSTSIVPSRVLELNVDNVFSPPKFAIDRTR